MMKFSGKRIWKKVRDRSGETLLEVLAGLLITALGALLLGSTVAASGNLIKKSSSKMSAVYDNVSHLEEESVPGQPVAMKISFDEAGDSRKQVAEIDIRDLTLYQSGGIIQIMPEKGN